MYEDGTVGFRHDVLAIEQSHRLARVALDHLKLRIFCLQMIKHFRDVESQCVPVESLREEFLQLFDHLGVCLHSMPRTAAPDEDDIYMMSKNTNECILTSS